MAAAAGPQNRENGNGNEEGNEDLGKENIGGKEDGQAGLVDQISVGEQIHVCDEVQFGDKFHLEQKAGSQENGSAEELDSSG